MNGKTEKKMDLISKFCGNMSDETINEKKPSVYLMEYVPPIQISNTENEVSLIVDKRFRRRIFFL